MKAIKKNLNDVPKAIERARGEKSSKEKSQIPMSAEPWMADLEELRVSGKLGKMDHLNTHESAAPNEINYGHL